MLAAQAETAIKCPECGRQAYSDPSNFEEKIKEDLLCLDFGRYQQMTDVDSSVLKPSYVCVKFGSQANQKPQKTNSRIECANKYLLNVAALPVYIWRFINGS
jgi:DNA-directed RNA polymerase subunit RPC12/RpoP